MVAHMSSRPYMYTPMWTPEPAQPDSIHSTVPYGVVARLTSHPSIHLVLIALVCPKSAWGVLWPNICPSRFGKGEGGGGGRGFNVRMVRVCRPNPSCPPKRCRFVADAHPSPIRSSSTRARTLIESLIGRHVAAQLLLARCDPPRPPLPRALLPLTSPCWLNRWRDGSQRRAAATHSTRGRQ